MHKKVIAEKKIKEAKLAATGGKGRSKGRSKGRGKGRGKGKGRGRGRTRGKGRTKIKTKSGATGSNGDEGEDRGSNGADSSTTKSATPTVSDTAVEFFEGLEYALYAIIKSVAPPLSSFGPTPPSSVAHLLTRKSLYEETNLIAFRGRVIRWPLTLPLQFYELFVPVDCVEVKVPAFVAASYVTVRSLHLGSKGKVTEPIAAIYQALKFFGYPYATLRRIKCSWLCNKLRTYLATTETSKLVRPPMDNKILCDNFAILLCRFRVLVYECCYRAIPFDLVRYRCFQDHRWLSSACFAFDFGATVCPSTCSDFCMTTRPIQRKLTKITIQGGKITAITQLNER